MSAPLNFGNDGNNPFDDTALAGFDAAPGNDGFDLAGFDKADGKVALAPPGRCICRLERGELTKTKAGRTSYRLCFRAVEPGEYAGFTFWRHHVMGDRTSDARAKQALGPLGLTTSANLHRPYPPYDREVFVEALITVKPPRNGYPACNNVEHFVPCDPPASAATPPNPFGVSLDAAEPEGVTP